MRISSCLGMRFRLAIVSAASNVHCGHSTSFAYDSLGSGWCEARMNCVPRQWLQVGVTFTRWLPYERAQDVWSVRTEGHATLKEVGKAQSFETR